MLTVQQCTTSDGKEKIWGVHFRQSHYISLMNILELWREPSLHTKRGEEKRGENKRDNGKGKGLREKSARQWGRTYGSHSSLYWAPASLPARQRCCQGIGRTPLVPSAHCPLLHYKPWCAITSWSSLLFCAWNPQPHTRFLHMHNNFEYLQYINAQNSTKRRAAN